MCACKHKGHEKIDVLTPKSIFEYFYSIDWSGKTVFLRSLVNRKHVKENFNRRINLKDPNFVSRYYLPDENAEKQQVCSSFLCKLLQISRSAVFKSVQSIAKNPNALELRGKCPTRKIDAREKSFVKTFIQKFATFESRCGSMYLHPRLNIKKLYELYKVDRLKNDKEAELMSKTMFQSIFKSHFNLCYLKRMKSCQTCKRIDAYESSQVISQNTKILLRRKKISHSKILKKIKKDFMDCVDYAKNNIERIEVFTFSIQRTLDMPSIDDEDSFQFRPLWCYNVCVNDELRNKSHMFIWKESVASKGSEEVASCLYKFLLINLPEETEKIILVSEPHAGLNRDMKFTLMLKNFFEVWNHPQLKTIEQRFIVTGHVSPPKTRYQI